MASQQAATVAAAIMQGRAPEANPASLQAAATYFEQLKQGEIHASTEVAAELAAPGGPIEVQHFGYALLQHLVGNRWVEYNEQEHAQLASLAFDMLNRVGASSDSWSVKSKAALLLALVVKRQGQQLWQALQPQLLPLAQQGPVQAEMVCMVLRFVAEEVMLYSEDLGQASKRALLAGQQASLPQLLPALTGLLEAHYGAALAAAQASDVAKAHAHAAAVTAGLGAVEVYAAWAPLGRMAEAGLLAACAFLLSTPDFRMTAVDILRGLASRKQAQEKVETFRHGQQEVGKALLRAAAPVLAPEAAPHLQYGGANADFGLRLADTMVEWGQKHLVSLEPPQRNAYLQQMLAFARQPFLLLSAAVIPFWLSLLPQSTPRAAEPLRHAPLPDDAAAALLDLAGERLRIGVQLMEGRDEVPDFFDTFTEYVEFCVDYRAKLAQIVKMTATWLPQQVLGAASVRLNAALQLCSPEAGTELSLQQQTLDTAIYFIECAAAAVSDVLVPPADASPRKAALQPAVAAAMDPILQAVLGMPPMRAPELLTIQARSLEALAGFLAARPASVPAALQKLFELQTQAIPLDRPGRSVPPEKPSASWRHDLLARQKVAGVMNALAKGCAAAMCPHLSGAAQQVQGLWETDLLRIGEYAVLVEGFVAAAAAGGDAALQSQVLQWTLEPVRAAWASPALSAGLASPAAFFGYYIALQPGPAGGVVVGGRGPRQDMYHEMHIIERSLRRFAPALPPPVPPSEVPKTAAPPVNAASHLAVVMPHLQWAIPVVLQFVRSLHAMWSREIAAGPLLAAAGALQMGAKERAVYLGHRLSRNIKVEGEAEEAEDTLAGVTVGALRNWLRQGRELSYQILGLAARLAPEQLPGDPAAWVAALTGALPDLHHQHLRIMERHILIPMLQTTPPAAREAVLLPVLHAVLPHTRTRLDTYWGALLSPGANAAAPSGSDPRSAAGANDEVVAERLLRELTREHVLLLAQLQAHDPPAAGAPAGSEGPTVLEWLLRADAEAAWAAIATVAAALTWPDESISRACGVCKLAAALAAAGGPLQGWLGRGALQQWAGTQLLAAGLTALGCSASAPAQVEVLQLIRTLLAQQLASEPGPRQVLMSALKVSEADLMKFHAEMMALNSEKDQRTLLKNFLFSSGVEQLQAMLRNGTGKPGIAHVGQPIIPLPPP